MKKNNKGFSLVELIIVIAIMAVLMAVLAPQFLRYVEHSRYQKDVSAIGELENAMKVAASNEACVVAVGAANWPVTATIDEDGDVTWSTMTGTAFEEEVNATIMGAAATDVDLEFTSTTIADSITGAGGGAATALTVEIADTGITTITGLPTAP